LFINIAFYFMSSNKHHSESSMKVISTSSDSSDSDSKRNSNKKPKSLTESLNEGSQIIKKHTKKIVDDHNNKHNKYGGSINSIQNNEEKKYKIIMTENSGMSFKSELEIINSKKSDLKIVDNIFNIKSLKESLSHLQMAYNIIKNENTDETIRLSKIISELSNQIVSNKYYLFKTKIPVMFLFNGSYHNAFMIGIDNNILTVLIDINNKLFSVMFNRNIKITNNIIQSGKLSSDSPSLSSSTKSVESGNSDSSSSSINSRSSSVSNSSSNSSNNSDRTSSPYLRTSEYDSLAGLSDKSQNFTESNEESGSGSDEDEDDDDDDDEEGEYSLSEKDSDSS